MSNCHWCDSISISKQNHTVYWELPDGTKAIIIEETPSIYCSNCEMTYQEEEIIKEIEDQLFLIDTKKLAKQVTYRELLEHPRLLKRNYFDFTS
jgi:uncharacterized YokU family protein